MLSYTSFIIDKLHPKCSVCEKPQTTSYFGYCSVECFKERMHAQQVANTLFGAVFDDVVTFSVQKDVWKAFWMALGAREVRDESLVIETKNHVFYISTWPATGVKQTNVTVYNKEIVNDDGTTVDI